MSPITASFSDAHAALLIPLASKKGIATALKILFASNDCGPAGAATLPPSQQQPQQHPPPPDDLTLERNEAIALINLLARFSNSLHKYREMSAALAAKGKGAAALAGGAAVS
jgi:hypothetical protein